MRPAFRLLPLPLCIAFSLSAHAADDERPQDWALCPVENAVPVFTDAQAPVGSPEARASQSTQVNADQVDGVSGHALNLQDNVTLRRADQYLHTDHMHLDEATGKYVAEGNVQYQDSGMRMLAESAQGDQERDTHTIKDVRYQLTARRGNGSAQSIQLDGTQGTMLGSSYSTCPPSQRSWELRAPRIDVDTDKGFATARNATIRVGKVPVLYIPWIKFPIDDQRHTGLLYPAIGNSNRNGFDIRQPIYLNLAPNYDMTLTPRLMTKRGLMLDTEFRYLTETGHGVLSAAYLPSDDLTDRERQEEIDLKIPEENRRVENRGYFSFKGAQKVNDQWQARANLNWISDPRYNEDFSNTLNGMALYRIQSDIGLYGRGRYWSGGVMADNYQLSDYTLHETSLPYNRLPRAYFDWEQPFTRWFTAGIDAEAVRFQHDFTTAQPGGGSRLDLKPYISLPFEGASWFVTPTLAYRYTGYEVDKALAQYTAKRNHTTIDQSPSRSLPIGSLDAGLYFDRNTTIHGESFLNTLEPRLFYLNAPYRDQSNLPLFDTQPLTFSWGQLFRDNRFSGADRQSDANQLTLALTSRLIREADGKEKLTASIGQIRYFDDSRVTEPGDSPIPQGKSAWVAETSWSPGDNWNIGTTYQWDPESRKEDLASLRLRYLLGDEGIINFSYRYRRDNDDDDDLLKQVDLSFLYPVTPSWSLVGRYYYSIKDKQILEGIAGVQWDSCCIAVRLVGRRYVKNRRGEMNNAIQLEIELKGLGSAGQDTESRLRRAILGYYREDLYLVPPAEVRTGAQDDNPPDPMP